MGERRLTMESSSPHSCLPFLREQLSALRMTGVQSEQKFQARRRLEALTDLLSLGELRSALEKSDTIPPDEENRILSLSLPDGGVFVNSQGLVISGALNPGVIRSHVGGAFDLVLPDEAQNILESHSGSRCLLFDWSSQSLDWAELSDRWQRWKSHILYNSPVDFPVELLGVCRLAHVLILEPGYLLEDLESLPLKETPQLGEPALPADRGSSFLARAELLKNQPRKVPEVLSPVSSSNDAAFDDQIYDELPMIPFTLQDLKDQSFSWPTGVDQVQVQMIKSGNMKAGSNPAVPEELSALENEPSPGDTLGYSEENYPSQKRKRKFWSRLFVGVGVLGLLAVGFYLWYTTVGYTLLPDLNLPRILLR